MARIRSIKPEFFTSETVAGLSVHARLTFVGLWTYADDAGRALDNPRLIKAAVWPLDDDVSAGDIARHLDELAKAGRICRYVLDGKRYLHFPTWDEHQKPKNPSDPKHPACPKQAHPGDDPGDGLPQPYPSPTPGQDQDEGSPSLPHARARSREQGAGSRGSASRVANATAVQPSPVVQIPTAQNLVAAYVDAYRAKAGHDPPSRVKGQLAREISQLLRDGVPVAAVKAGMREWFGLNTHPSTLASFVEVEARGGQARASPDKAQRQVDQARRTYEEMMADADAADRVGRGRGQAQPELPPPADHQGDR